MHLNLVSPKSPTQEKYLVVLIVWPQQSLETQDSDAVFLREAQKV